MFAEVTDDFARTSRDAALPLALAPGPCHSDERSDEEPLFAAKLDESRFLTGPSDRFGMTTAE